MEKAIYWFTRNHVAANLLMIAIMVMGLTTWGKLKKEIFPETAINAVTIQVPVELVRLGARGIAHAHTAQLTIHHLQIAVGIDAEIVAGHHAQRGI